MKTKILDISTEYEDINGFTSMSTVCFKINIQLSLWSAIKLRIAGIYYKFKAKQIDIRGEKQELANKSLKILDDMIDDDYGHRIDEPKQLHVSHENTLRLLMKRVTKASDETIEKVVEHWKENKKLLDLAFVARVLREGQNG